MSFKPTSKIFDKQARRTAFAANPVKAARFHKNNVAQENRKAIPSGNSIRTVRGRGFRFSRNHSRRGERPAIITGAVVNGGEVTRISDTAARFDYSDRKHPDTNLSIKDVAELLQTRLSREVVAPEDVKKADEYFQELNEKTLKSLL